MSVPTGAFVARRNGHIFITGNSGFPKSLNVGKAIDKAAGAEREIVGIDHAKMVATRNYGTGNCDGTGMHGGGIKGNIEKKFGITAPATAAAATWEGYGTALKPAVEVIVVARKPVEGTIAENCERYGSGALAIDECRVGTGKDGDPNRFIGVRKFNGNTFASDNYSLKMTSGMIDNNQGRWPANLLLDDSKAVAGLFPVTTSGERRAGKRANGVHNYGFNASGVCEASEGSAARFFYQATWELDQAEQLDAADVLKYCAKASRAERDAGLEGFEARVTTDQDKWAVNDRRNGTARQPTEWKQGGVRNHHPTVKPLTLCRYLAALLLPPAAYAPRRILVPFGGVASEAIGAGLAGWDEIVMVESEHEYCDIAKARLAYWLRQPELALR